MKKYKDIGMLFSLYFAISANIPFKCSFVAKVKELFCAGICELCPKFPSDFHSTLPQACHRSCVCHSDQLFFSVLYLLPWALS